MALRGPARPWRKIPYTVAMRLLAANLANLGNIDDASEAVAEFLRIEPDLTITKLRARLDVHERGLVEQFNSRPETWGIA